MSAEKGTPKFTWEHFIDPATKAASPQFDEFSRSLARIIRRTQPSYPADLSPERLANFYISCGGNRDELFRNIGDHGLSFMYRTLGCFHSLQPTRNAFEAPTIPCLTDDGFVRWQTLQLLLCPQEHAPMLQKAVEIYDVPKRGGGYFPKSIPAECFPAKPDVEMEKWHRFVTSQMNQDYVRRLKYSPYQSPQPDLTNGSNEYFPRAPPVRRPSVPRRGPSVSEEEAARFEAARRRSSVPDVLSPGGTPIYPEEREPAQKVRSHSSNRTSGSGQRPRASTGAPVYHYPPPERRTSQGYPSHRHASRESLERERRREPRRHSRNYSSSSRPPSSSESSAEEVFSSRRPRPSEDDKQRRPRWGATLMPSFFLSSSKRRHSSDGRVPTMSKDKARSPKRSEPMRKYRSDGPPDPYLGRSPVRASTRSRSNSRFNEPDLPPLRTDDFAYGTPPTSYRYSEPQPNLYQPNHPPPGGRGMNSPYGPQNPPSAPPLYPSPTFESSFTSADARKYGMPLRVSTVGGVNGRRYVPPENRSAVEPRLMRRDRTASLRNPATASAI